MRTKEFIPLLTGRGVSPILSLHRQLSDVLGDIFEGFEPTSSISEKLSAFCPRANFLETEKQALISLEIPGLDPKDVEISLTKEAITIRGEKKVEADTSSGSVKLVERGWGKFQRSFPLDFPHDTDNVDAVFEKGVLTITIPKLKASDDSVRRVTIRSAS